MKVQVKIIILIIIKKNYIIRNTGYNMTFSSERHVYFRVQKDIKLTIKCKHTGRNF